MNHKQIQEQRIKGYFIQAAKDLVKGEGLRSVNVRSVASQAGYSYATMYNYFKDLNELIFLTVQDFQEDCRTIVHEKTQAIPQGKERIVAIAKAYISYFVEYPSLFELFFVERMRDMGSRKNISELIYNFLDDLCAEDWQYCIQTNTLTGTETKKMKASLRFTVMGMLLFYMNRLQPDTYDAFMKNVNEQISGILEV